MIYDWNLLAGLFALCFHVHVSEAVPVYGFQGASATVASGRTLHYSVHLKQCKSIDGPTADAEFIESFGGPVTIWRSFFDRDISDVQFMVFFDQKLLFNSKGQLAQLAREVEVWDNGTAIVTSIAYTADYSIVTSFQRHMCTLASQSKTGDINFQTSAMVPKRLYSVDEIMASLEDGHGVRFLAPTFLCRGGREHSFSNFGGHIINYEMNTESGMIHEIRSSVQQTVHYDVKTGIHVLDVIDMRIYDNRTVEIIDIRGRPLYQDLVHVHVSYCTLHSDMPGGTFSAFT